jgi:hypothetical protein
MDPSQIEKLVNPISTNSADIVKGTRFKRDGEAKKMPLIRICGTFILTLLMRLSTGYWHLTDPQNGFIGFSQEVLYKLNFDELKSCFAFENSLLIQCSKKGFKLKEVGVFIRYDGEVSHLKISKFIRDTAPYLLTSFIKRIFYNLLFNFPTLSSLGYLTTFLVLIRQVFYIIDIFIVNVFDERLVPSNPLRETLFVLVLLYFSIWLDKLETALLDEMSN